MHYNLRHNPEILEYQIKTLHVIQQSQMLWSPDIIALNKEISDLSSQNHTLAMLNQQGLVDPDTYISTSNQLAQQLRNAKQQKEKLLNKENVNFIEQTQMVLEILMESPEWLEAFDEELFCELIDKVIVESNTKIRFRLKNGLELPEAIERTVR